MLYVAETRRVEADLFVPRLLEPSDQVKMRGGVETQEAMRLFAPLGVGVYKENHCHDLKNLSVLQLTSGALHSVFFHLISLSYFYLPFFPCSCAYGHILLTRFDL